MRASVAFLFLSVAALVADERLTMGVTPNVSFAPGTIRVRAVVQRDAENRALLLVAESTSYYRSSEVYLEGDRAARITVIRFQNLPQGDYRITATLLGVGDVVLATVNQAVLVRDPHVALSVDHS